MGSDMATPYWARQNHQITGTDHSIPSAVKVSGTTIYWRLGVEQAPNLGSTGLVRFADSLFDDDGQPKAEKIERFAARFGALRLCGHGLPASHQIASPGQRPCTPVRGEGEWQGWFCEPLSAWAQLVREARAMLLMAPDLDAGQPASITQLEVFGAQADRRSDLVGEANPLGLVDLKSDLPGHVVYERRQLAFRVTEWLRIGGVGPSVEWVDGRGLEQSWRGEGLFGALALQLAAQLGRGGQVECQGCGRLITPNHSRTGQRHWCVTCTKNGTRRRAIDRERRQRQKDGVPPDPRRGRYAAQGETIARPSRGR